MISDEPGDLNYLDLITIACAGQHSSPPSCHRSSPHRRCWPSCPAWPAPPGFSASPRSPPSAQPGRCWGWRGRGQPRPGRPPGGPESSCCPAWCSRARTDWQSRSGNQGRAQLSQWSNSYHRTFQQYKVENILPQLRENSKCRIDV